MVMRILGTTSSGNVQLFRGRHTGQEAVSKRLLQKERSRMNLSHRRRLRHTQLKHRAELASAFVIDVDAHLLTGNLDHDITILNVVA